MSGLAMSEKGLGRVKTLRRKHGRVAISAGWHARAFPGFGGSFGLEVLLKRI